MMEDAIRIVRILLGDNSTVQETDISRAIDRAMLVYPNINREQLCNAIRKLYNVRIGDLQILEGKDRRIPWLRNWKAEHRDIWHFWKRYKIYLQDDKGFEPSVITSIDNITDVILDKLFNPITNKDIVISKRGLVVGQVQSGKTANYISLINKAADVGFDVIIVLTGIHENLRIQTQKRLDLGFLGFNTKFGNENSNNGAIGVGNSTENGDTTIIANSFTTITHDFVGQAARAIGLNFNAPSPILFVVKKNARVLASLNSYFNAQKGNNENITNKTILVIDDEADNASINIARNEEDRPSSINRNIRKILNKFARSAYVGYTATPFANIFIPQDEDDLFPRDFIINLPTSSNYVGPTKLFGKDEDSLMPILSIINDSESFVPIRHNVHSSMPTIDMVPESLKLAIKSFILTCAIRRCRGDKNVHNSMLIHISRYNVWQTKIAELVSSVFGDYKSDIEQGGDLEIFEELKLMYECDSATRQSYKTISNMMIERQLVSDDILIPSWEQVRDELYPVVEKIEVLEINGSSRDVLSYDDHEKDGLYVIAIGGDKLSRGLTLEGLSVSYFLRASKMYDTLMQMGRWFGYRDNYNDLCRLYMSEELAEWFRHITLASEELREEFDYLNNMNATPEDYSLKVRVHPGSLQITAAMKLHDVNIVRVSWSGKLVETYQLYKNKNIKYSNFDTTVQFVESIGEPKVDKDNYLWLGVPSDNILSFFHGYNLPSSLAKVNLELISQYIQELVKDGDLRQWNVAIINKNRGERNGEPDGYIGNYPINFSKRRSAQQSDEFYYMRNNRVISPLDEFIDINQDVYDQALQETIKLKPTWDHEYPNSRILRELYREFPLLIIYPLKPDDGYVVSKEENIPYIGFAISFPSTDHDMPIEYAINNVGYTDNTEEIFDNENINENERINIIVD